MNNDWPTDADYAKMAAQYWASRSDMRDLIEEVFEQRYGDWLLKNTFDEGQVSNDAD